MSDIPQEIITSILFRLPVTSLLRFRCVSKSLKALIDSPNFIKTHLRQQALKPNSDLKLILNNGNFFSIDFNSIGTSKAQELDHPLKLSNDETYAKGSYHGLVLISSSNLLCLWNPSTKVFRKLPFCDLFEKPQGKGEGYLRVFYGFGYDSSSDDYKVVQVAQWSFSVDSIISQIMIYTLKSDSWRKVEESADWFIWGSDGKLARGVLHWLATDMHLPKPNRCVIGFNLSTEKIELVPFPENLGNLGVSLHLVVLGECLCLLETYANDHVLDHKDIWVMKDYGVKESWIKLFSVGQRDGLQSVKMKPIAYSQNGREVLLQTDAKMFFWYSLETSSLKNATVCGELDDFDSFLCLGTLVPLHGGGNGNNKEKSIDQDKRGKGRARKRDDFLSKGFKLKL